MRPPEQPQAQCAWADQPVGMHRRDQHGNKLILR
jgi:hypothetical protein